MFLASTFLMSAIYLMLRVQSSGFPQPFTPQQEQEHLNRMLAGDLSAKQALIEHNLRLVAHIVKKYYSDPADQDDFISIGTIGLMKAINTYRPDRGVKLATYAARCIENEILMYFRANRRSASEISLSETLDHDGDNHSLSLMDFISCEDSNLQAIENHDQYEQLYAHLSQLNERERQILQLRYGLGGKEPMTQREVAQQYGISRSYVSRIEKKALKQLASALGTQTDFSP